MRTRPSRQQLEWQRAEIGMFVHFGLYTFRNRKEWTTPGDPSVFNPDRLDARQWVDVARSIGARYIVLTAKHADGFCLWQTDTTDYGVKSSPWKDGKGDLVEDLSEACRTAGMKFGVYLSPADAVFGAKVGGRASDPAKQEAYDRVYRRQLTELLSRYGEVYEVWFDGSCVTEVGDILSELAPDAMVFQSKFGTIRWVGNEAGYAPYPAWNSVRSVDGRTGVATGLHGDPDGDMWLPNEVDTTIRGHHWMWEENTEDRLKSLDSLVEIYYRSVGHGAVLLLNSNPDTSGLIPAADAKRAAEFGAEIRRRFAVPLAEINGGENEIILDIDPAAEIDHVVSEEDVSQGESIREYIIEGFCDGGWEMLAAGSAVGNKKIDFFSPRTVSKVRFRTLDSDGTARIRRVAAYSCGAIPDFDRDVLVVHDPFLLVKWEGDPAGEPIRLEHDISKVCQEARQYTLELRPDPGSPAPEVDSIELLHEGAVTEGYVSPTEEPGCWNLNITAFDSDYSIRVILKNSGAGNRGRVEIR